MMSLELYSNEQFEKIYSKIYKELTHNIVPSKNPQAHILGGQPGAGKSTFHEIFTDKYDYNVIIINGDDFRKFHPAFDEIQKKYGQEAAIHTQPFINQVNNRLIDDLSKKKYNLIIEGTLRTAEIPIKTCNLLKKEGYNVELSIMATNPEISWKSTLYRYNQMKKLGMSPRATPKEHHDLVVKEINENIDVIYNSNTFDNISIYQRTKKCIYNQKFTPDLPPSFVLKNIVSMNEKTIDEKQQVFHLDKFISPQKPVEHQYTKDPYVYLESNVLINKLGIRDDKLLRETEGNIIFVKLLGIDSLLENKTLDFDYLKKIHKYLFEDLYEFAGKVRKIPMYKPEFILSGETIKYALPKDITTEANIEINKMNKIDWKSLNQEEKAEEFSKNIAKLWKVHPFREGNTRTVMIFASHFGEVNGFPLDKQLFAKNSSYVRNSLVKANDSITPDHKYLTKIIKDAMVLGEELYITQEIAASGYKPSNKLIMGMKNLNHTFNKLHSVLELKNLSKNKDLSEKESLVVNKTIDLFI